MSRPAQLCTNGPDDTSQRQDCPLPVARIVSPDHSVPEGHGTHAQRELVAAAKRYVAAHAEERVGLTEVSRSVGVSAPYLTSVFRAVEGLPLYQYLLRTRLERALALLPQSPGDLSQIALDMGFSSHSHFSAAFRRMFGCAPTFVRTRAQAVCRTIRSVAARAEDRRIHGRL